MFMLPLLELVKDTVQICTLLNTTKSILEAFLKLIEWSLKIYFNLVVNSRPYKALVFGSYRFPKRQRNKNKKLEIAFFPLLFVLTAVSHILTFFMKFRISPIQIALNQSK